MTARRRCAGTRAALVAAVLTTALGGCGDGTPAFCQPLAHMSDLDALAGALDADDLDAARAEAQRLRDLADDAPAEIRADFAALANAVVDIVELLEQEQVASAPSPAEGEAGTTPGGVEEPGTIDATDIGPAEVERRREALNARLGDLDRRGTRVSTWAARECGLELG
jgi:hypothetical protein